MIPCHELRIGNYVLVDKNLPRISRINNTTVSVVDGEKSNAGLAPEHNFQQIQPVPLTDDLLRQCGFVYHDYFKFGQHVTTTTGMRSEMDIDKDYDIVDFMRKPIIKKVTSLHQLQNIYFMLRGKELNFKKTVAESNSWLN